MLKAVVEQNICEHERRWQLFGHVQVCRYTSEYKFTHSEVDVCSHILCKWP